MAILKRLGIFLLVFGLAACLAAPASGSAAGWVGSKAPEITVNRMMSPPDADVSLEAMRGRTVVLLFWATDCPTCPTVIPHINRLVERFEDEPVTFLSVLSEPEQAIQTFLDTKMEVKTWIGLDIDMSMTRDYFIPGVPMSIVINSAGVVAARTHPINLSERVIRQTMAGRTASTPLFEWPEQYLFTYNPKQPVVFELSMRPAEPNAERQFMRVGGLRLRGSELREAIAMAYNVNQHNIVSSTALLDAKFDVTVVPPVGKEHEVRAMMRELLERTLGLTTHTETREMTVYEVYAPEGPGRHLQPTTESRRDWDFKPGTYTGQNVTLVELLYYVFVTLNMPVFDESGLEGGFDFRLTWNESNPESIIPAMRRQLGLEMRKTTREMEVLVVELE